MFLCFLLGLLHGCCTQSSVRRFYTRIKDSRERFKFLWRSVIRAVAHPALWCLPRTTLYYQWSSHDLRRIVR